MNKNERGSEVLVNVIPAEAGIQFQMVSKIFALTFVMLAFVPMLYAGTATTSANFLLENTSARQIGMGGVFSATAEGPESIPTNPAGLYALPYPKLSFSYASTQNNSGQSFVGYAQSLFRGHPVGLGLGAAVSYYSAGNVDINNLDGTTQSFNAERGYSWMLSSCLRYKNWLAFGVTPKFIRSTLVEQYTGTAFAFDLGIMVRPLPEPFRERMIVGAALQNLGTAISYLSVQQDLPRTGSIGAAARLMDSDLYGSIIASAQLENTLREKVRSRIGGEYALGMDSRQRVLFLRGGYFVAFDDQTYSVGIGLREKNLELDYAFVNGSFLEVTHRFTLSFRFGKSNGGQDLPGSSLPDL